MNFWLFKILLINTPWTPALRWESVPGTPWYCENIECDPKTLVCAKEFASALSLPPGTQPWCLKCSYRLRCPQTLAFIHCLAYLSPTQSCWWQLWAQGKVKTLSYNKPCFTRESPLQSDLIITWTHCKAEVHCASHFFRKKDRRCKIDCLLPCSQWSCGNKEFLFQEVQITVAERTGNLEYLAVSEVVEPLKLSTYTINDTLVLSQLYRSPQ